MNSKAIHHDLINSVPIQRLVQAYLVPLTKIERGILLNCIVIYVGNPKWLDRNSTNS